LLFVLVGLWTVGLMLLITDPRRATTRWISSIAFTGGSGGLAVVLNETIVPGITSSGVYPPEWIFVLEQLETASSRVCYYGLPYTFLMFAIVYIPYRLPVKLRKVLPYALLAPAALSLALPPEPGHTILYRAVVWWAAPYILIGITLLIWAAAAERNTFLRRTRMLTAIAAVPALFTSMFTLYILPAYWGGAEWWRYNVAMIAFTLAVIFVSSIRYGFMGLQISIRNQKLDYTLKAITSGTAILNHAIKNDVGKIKLFSQNIRASAAAKGDQELVSDIEVIMAASQHIYDMIFRIQDQTQEAELQLEEERLDELIKLTLTGLRHELSNIEVKTELLYDKPYRFDRAQIGEVLTNIITNAAEAMPDGGQLSVKLSETKRHIVLEIRDTGKGMEKSDLKRVFDPFYTTKGGSKSGKKLNFGLGLSYCYHVVQKHKGSMNIQSKIGSGTTVYMNFPKKRG
jgi:signal transduction histidine kinase